jgi:hypothetical protein
VLWDTDQEEFQMRSWIAAIVLVSLVVWSRDCPAQVVDPGPVRVGDRWSYDLKDGVTGEVRQSYSYFVFDINDKEIVTRMIIKGPEDRYQTVVFNLDWGLMDNGVMQSSPSELSFKKPLQVGKTWPWEVHTKNLQDGSVWRTSGTARVADQERITTRAGTFDTFRIEAKGRQVNANDQTKSNAVIQTFWYAPAVNRWVKRTFEGRSEGRVRDAVVEELTAYWFPGPGGSTGQADRHESAVTQTEDPGPVRVGDRWSYNIIDNATGNLVHAVTIAVVSMTDKDITARVTPLGNFLPKTAVFDHDWGRIDDGTWRVRPADAGIRKPLQVGKEWRSEASSTNPKTGEAYSFSWVTKVVAQEQVTTPAGTFDTYRVEAKMRQVNTKDQTRAAMVTHTFWYAPAVKRWVKKGFEARFEGRLRESVSEVLTGYSLTDSVQNMHAAPAR